MKLKSKKERREQIFAPQRLSNGWVLSLDAPQGLELKEFALQGLSLTSIRAFSVAEAMIALLIGTIILGFSAPMITKQLKHNNFTSIQTQVLNKKIENVDDKIDANNVTLKTHSTNISKNSGDIIDIKEQLTILKTELGKIDYSKDISSLQTQVNSKASSTKVNELSDNLTTLEDDVTDLEDKIKNLVPKGAIMFFEQSCPDRWTDLSGEYAGRYVRIDGTYDVCDKQGENAATGECVAVKSTAKLSAGTKQGESNRRVLGTLPGNDADVSYYSKNDYVAKLKYYGVLTGAFDYVKSSEISDTNSVFTFPNNWSSLHWLDNKGYAKIYKTENTYLQYVDPSVLSVHVSTGAPNWFITSIDTKRVLPTDTINDETRPKTIVLKACKAPGN